MNRAARGAYCEALALARERQALPEVLEALTGMASWSAQQGEPEQALVSAPVILNHSAATEQTKEAARQLQSKVALRLGTEQVEAARTGVQDLSFEPRVASMLAPVPVKPGPG